MGVGNSKSPSDHMGIGTQHHHNRLGSKMQFEDSILVEKVPKLRLNFLNKMDDVRRPISARYRRPDPF